MKDKCTHFEDMKKSIESYQNYSEENQIYYLYN